MISPVPSSYTGSVLSLCTSNRLGGYVRQTCRTARLRCVSLDDWTNLAREVAVHRPDAIIIEDSPNVDATSLIGRLREVAYQGQITVLSPEYSGDALIRVLESGGDDYLSIDTAPELFTSLLRVRLRRQGMVQEAPAYTSPSTTLEFSDLRIDSKKRTVLRAGTPIDLHEVEFDMLYYLAKNSDRVVSYSELMRESGGAGGNTESTVRWHISNLRAKLEPAPRKPRYIKGVHKIGYRFSGSPLKLTSPSGAAQLS